MKINIIITDEKGNFYEGFAVLKKVTKKITKKIGKKITKKDPSQTIFELFEQNFFSNDRKLIDVVNKIKGKGYNFGKSSISMALTRADYLKQQGTKGKYTFIQKYPP